MSTKVVHTPREDKQGLQKQLGCMNGIFQLFDRRYLLGLHRHGSIQNRLTGGLKYGTVACCGNGGGRYNFNPQVFCGNTKFINGQNLTALACDDPENYVRWDGVHTTEVANKIIVDAIFTGEFTDLPFEIQCS